LETIAFRCKHCEARIGDMTERALIVGGGVVKQSITIYCFKCSRRNKWIQSSSEPLPVNKHSNENPVLPPLLATILASVEEAGRTWQQYNADLHPPRRDADIDRAEANADKIKFDALAQHEPKEIKKKVG